MARSEGLLPDAGLCSLSRRAHRVVGKPASVTLAGPSPSPASTPRVPRKPPRAAGKGWEDARGGDHAPWLGRSLLSQP